MAAILCCIWLSQPQAYLTNSPVHITAPEQVRHQTFDSLQNSVEIQLLHMGADAEAMSIVSSGQARVAAHRLARHAQFSFQKAQ